MNAGKPELRRRALLDAVGAVILGIWLVISVLHGDKSPVPPQTPFWRRIRLATMGHVATVVIATASVVGLVITQSTLKATQRQVKIQAEQAEAQTDPVIVGAPVGNRLPEPEAAAGRGRLYVTIRYPGEIVLGTTSSIPVQNIGGGPARITGASIRWSAEVSPRGARNAGTLMSGSDVYLAAGAEHRFNSYIRGFPAPQGIFTVDIRFQNITGSRHWESQLAIQESGPIPLPRRPLDFQFVNSSVKELHK